MDPFFEDRLRDLSAQSEKRSRYTFTVFLTPEELGVLQRMKGSLGSFTLFGGAEGTERCMARFGCEETLGYTEPFPIVCLRIRPKGENSPTRSPTAIFWAR